MGVGRRAFAKAVVVGKPFADVLAVDTSEGKRVHLAAHRGLVARGNRVERRRTAERLGQPREEAQVRGVVEAWVTRFPDGDQRGLERRLDRGEPRRASDPPRLAPNGKKLADPRLDGQARRSLREGGEPHALRLDELLAQLAFALRREDARARTPKIGDRLRGIAPTESVTGAVAETIDARGTRLAGEEKQSNTDHARASTHPAPS